MIAFKSTMLSLLSILSLRLNGFKIYTNLKVAKFESIIIALMKLNSKSSFPLLPKKNRTKKSLVFITSFIIKNIITEYFYLSKF